MCKANSYSCWPWGDSAECKNVEEPKQGESQEAYDARVSLLGWRIGHWDGQAYYVCPDHHSAVWDALPISMDEDLDTAASAQAAIDAEKAKVAELEALVASYRKTADLEAQGCDAAEARVDRLAEIASKLDAAIAWLDYPFIDNRTPEAELRQRIGFMMKDAEPNRAALQQETQK